MQLLEQKYDCVLNYKKRHPIKDAALERYPYNHCIDI